MTSEITAERPRFYPRQIITAEDLTLDQNYFINKMRLHNRTLHGWGVVCGATLDYSTTAWMIQIKAGVVLGPYGDEIVIGRDRCFDLRTRCATGTQQGQDPCADVWRPQPQPAQTAANTTAIVAIQYLQLQGRPVRVKASGCGCDENACEGSRWQDSYQICVLDALPNSHTGDPVTAPVITGDAPGCPALPTDPWVVLGTVTVQPDGTVVSVSYQHRRQVVSFAPCWWRPSDPPANTKKS